MHYALGIPYAGQHGDDEERWLAAYGALPDEPGEGMNDPPPASAQPEHAWAMGLADRAIAEAERRGARIAVAVVDRRGEPIQQDCTDGAPTVAKRSEGRDPRAGRVLPELVALELVARGDAQRQARQAALPAAQLAGDGAQR